MKTQHLNLFYPQWQGGGRELMTGACELEAQYIKGFPFTKVYVPMEDPCLIEKDIIGYWSILNQLTDACEKISTASPETIFTIGGGCDVEIPPVSYLNHNLNGDLTILWIDAHGDLNTPKSSTSHKFHGMPLRALLGEGDNKISEMIPTPLCPEQLIMIGQRSLDFPEIQYIQENSIEMFTIDQISENTEPLIKAILGKSQNIYIHIDLDVLDKNEFPFVSVPEKDGMKKSVLMDVLQEIRDKFVVKGLSLLEYTGSGECEIQLLNDIIAVGLTLGDRKI